MGAKQSRRDWMAALGVWPKHQEHRHEPSMWGDIRERDVAVSGQTTDLDGSVGGACPVQGEGLINGLPWYFRARGGVWRFSIAATPCGDPVLLKGGGWRWEGGDDFRGWMPAKHAARIIRRCVAEFQADPTENRAEARS